MGAELKLVPDFLICKKCKEIKPRICFYASDSRCKDCKSAASKAWRLANYEERRTKEIAYRIAHPEKVKNSKLLNLYGITTEEYNKMFELQKGCCAICNKHQAGLKKPLAIDHDHETNRVRGLLCVTCNCGIGLLRDSSEIIDSASIYLKRFNK